MIEPIGERILIKPVREEEKTIGGLYIPASAQEERKEGEIIAVGTFKDGKPLPLKKGDKIIYGGYSSDYIMMDGEKHIMIEFKDILAKIV